MGNKLTDEALQELVGYSKILYKAVKNKDTQEILNIANSLVIFMSKHSQNYDLDMLQNQEASSLTEALGNISKVSGIEPSYEILKKRPIKQSILEIGIKLERSLNNLISSQTY